MKALRLLLLALRSAERRYLVKHVSLLGLLLNTSRGTFQPEPITEVTFMSHGVRSEPLAAEAEQRTLDLEIGSRMTDAIYLDIRHQKD